MRLEDFMNTEIVSVPSHEPLSQAAELMERLRIHHVVVSDAGKVVGVVSERDLPGEGVAAFLDGKTVSEVMTTAVITASPTTTVREAANLMRGHGVGCIPVTDGGDLCGIVTVSDLLDLIGRGLEKPVRRVDRPILSRWRSKRRLPH